MSLPDNAAELAAELRSLSPRDRRLLLQEFSPFERARVTALIEADRAPEEPAAPASPWSPWLAAIVDDARSGTAPAAGGPALTPAARALLLELALETPLRTRVDASAPANDERRSLLGVLVDLLSGRRGRS